MGRKSMVCCYARLHAEQRPYAGFPEGIPEGLPFGTFLAARLSFFYRTWGLIICGFPTALALGRKRGVSRGALLDGERYYPERLPHVKEQILDFWRSFRRECHFRWKRAAQT